MLISRPSGSDAIIMITIINAYVSRIVWINAFFCINCSATNFIGPRIWSLMCKVMSDAVCGCVVNTFHWCYKKLYNLPGTWHGKSTVSPTSDTSNVLPNRTQLLCGEINTTFNKKIKIASGLCRDNKRPTALNSRIYRLISPTSFDN